MTKSENQTNINEPTESVIFLFSNELFLISIIDYFIRLIAVYVAPQIITVLRIKTVILIRKV